MHAGDLLQIFFGSAVQIERMLLEPEEFVKEWGLFLFGLKIVEKVLIVGNALKRLFALRALLHRDTVLLLSASEPDTNPQQACNRAYFYTPPGYGFSGDHCTVTVPPARTSYDAVEPPDACPPMFDVPYSRVMERENECVAPRFWCIENA
jgi:hypothetical protein